MAKSKQDKAREEAIANLGKSFIFEISDNPIAPEDRLENWELGFVANNPWWAEPGEPEDVPEIIRDYAIDELRKQLPKGYSIEDETIINPCNNDYLKETIKRLQDLVKHPDKITSYPLSLRLVENGSVPISQHIDLLPHRRRQGTIHPSRVSALHRSASWRTLRKALHRRDIQLLLLNFNHIFLLVTIVFLFLRLQTSRQTIALQI